MSMGTMALIQPPKWKGKLLPKVWNAPTGLFLVIRPRVVSDMMRT